MMAALRKLHTNKPNSCYQISIGNADSLLQRLKWCNTNKIKKELKVRVVSNFIVTLQQVAANG